MKMIHVLSGITLTVTALTACSTQPPKNALLDDARNSYSTAQSDPNVTSLAPLELQEAGKALDEANVAQEKRENEDDINHLAYLAKQRVEIAQETARRKVSEQSVSNNNTERDKILLEQRTAEAEAARQRAMTAEQSASRKTEELAASVTATDAVRQQALMAEEAASQREAELAASNDRIKQMEEELAGLNAKKTERGMVVTLGDVLFDTNKAVLKTQGIASIQKLAKFLNEYPERKILVQGYTDSTGEADYNQKLSENRANAVKERLTHMGVSGDRIDTYGYGEEDPVADNDTPAGRQMNRRVEIVFPEDNGERAAL